jgi:hypothetical protein
MKASDLAKVSEISAHLEHLKMKLEFVETESWTAARVLADGTLEPLDPRTFTPTRAAIGARELLKSLTADEINQCKRELMALGVEFDEPQRLLAAPPSAIMQDAA